MLRRLSRIAVGFLMLGQFACGGGSFRRAPNAGSSGTPSANIPMNISISPASAMVGTPDLTLTIGGSHTFTFAQGRVRYNTVVWSQGGIDTPLLTTFVSSSQLTATVPAALLASPVTATIHVEIWDRIEGTAVATSRFVPFQVTSSRPQLQFHLFPLSPL